MVQNRQRSANYQSAHSIGPGLYGTNHPQIRRHPLGNLAFCKLE
jgi:hypothetical protein